MVFIGFGALSDRSFDPDAMLVERFVGGDTAAFQTIYELYYSKVYAIARGVLLDADEAADAAQEVFTAIYKSLHKFDGRARFSTWVHRIAVNRSIQHARTLKNRSRLEPLNEAVDAAAPTHEPSFADETIANCLEALSAEDRAIIVLYYWQEMPLDEIGAALGCNANAAKTRLFRARERFKNLYTKEAS